jgi:hypothetical protein
MTKRGRLTVIALVAAGVIAAAAGIGIAAAGDDDQPLEGSALDRATEAALAETGGGEVIETEAGDDGAAYGVEIRTPGGSVVEVDLDEDFRVIESSVDDDGAGEGDDGPGEGDDDAGEDDGTEGS